MVEKFNPAPLDKHPEDPKEVRTGVKHRRY